MPDIAYAIKYRPRKLSDIVGQKATVQALTNAFKFNDLHHAYIFAGNLGCGKTSAARIVAATENCPHVNKDGPCGKCNICKDIFAGTSLDVKEIDAASNRGVDDIRNLKREAQFNPVDCQTKYFIIDECHSLTGIAAEAALKLIEEPPLNVRFILCTTDAHLLKDTIHSRCIFFKFNKVSWPELYDHIEKIAKIEGLTFEEDALKLAAKAAKGSVRDALQNLQMIESYVGSENTLTQQDARDILGVPEERLFFELIEAISEINAPKAIRTVNTLLKDGKEAGEIIDGLQNHLRNLMIVMTCHKDLEPFGFMEDEIKRYKHQISKFSNQQISGTQKVHIILDWLKLLYHVAKGLQINLDLQVLLEAYIIEAIMAKKAIEKSSN